MYVFMIFYISNKSYSVEALTKNDTQQSYNTTLIYKI